MMTRTRRYLVSTLLVDIVIFFVICSFILVSFFFGIEYFSQVLALFSAIVIFSLILIMLLYGKKIRAKYVIMILLYGLISYTSSIFSLNTTNMIVTSINTFIKVFYIVLPIIVLSTLSDGMNAIIIQRIKTVIFPVVYLLTLYNIAGSFLVARSISVNSIYYLVFLVPVMVYNAKFRDALLTYALTFILTLLSLKLTANIALIIMFLVDMLLFIYNVHDKQIQKEISLFVFFTILMFIFLILIVNSLPDIQFISRFQLDNILDSGGSGRFSIWDNVIDLLLASSNNQFLFGHGFDGVSSLSSWRISAHNDYLEILFDYGIIALFCYLSFFFGIFTGAVKVIGFHSIYMRLLILSLIGWFVVSMFSHIVIYQSYGIILAFCLGIVIKILNNEEIKCQSQLKY